MSRSQNNPTKQPKPPSTTLIEYHKLVANMPIPVVVWGADRAIRTVNPAFLKLSGFSEKDLVGTRPPYPFWKTGRPGYYRDGYFKTDSRARQWEIRTAQGTEIYVEITNQAVSQPDGNSFNLSFILDITEKKKALTEVEKLREKWTRVFNVIPVPMSIGSIPDNKIVDVNQAFLKTAKMGREAFIGKPIPDIKWQNLEEQARVNQKFNKKGEVSGVEMRLQAKDGITHVALLSVRQVKLKDEQFSVSVSTDITKMKQAEEALRRSEAFNSSLLNNAPNPVVVTNPDSSIRYVNPAFCRLTGFSKKELLGQKQPYIWWPGDKNDEYYDENRRSFVREINGLERRIVNKKGETIWINISTRHVEEGKQIKYFLAIWTDVTARKNTEDALRESEAFNMLLLDSSPNPILVNYPDTTIKYVNPALENLTGFSSQEFIGKKSPFPWWPEEKVEEYRIENKSTQGQEISNRERLFRKKNGQNLWVNTTIRRIDVQGKPKYFLANWVDVTERRKLEESLNTSYQHEKLQREELEEEARLRGHFINILAHELRTPITPILSSTDMLKQLYASKKDSIQKQLVENIFNSSNTLAHRLEELLDMARNARGAFKLNIQPIELAPFLKGVITRFKPALSGPKQKLAVQMPREMPMAELDASRLEQVFINLLSNASKFSPEKSTITLDIKATESDLTVDVTDTGVGISEEGQARLFQPYYRVEQDRHQVQGLGLGLAVSKQIIEAHGGKIRVSSVPGRGSTFSFKIPLKQSG